MRLNVNRLLHTPDASQEVRFEMDLSQLDLGRGSAVAAGDAYDAALRV